MDRAPLRGGEPRGRGHEPREDGSERGEGECVRDFSLHCAEPVSRLDAERAARDDSYRVRPLSEFRELAVDGATSLDQLAVLLVEFRQGAVPAREFRTGTVGSPAVVPPLSSVTTDTSTKVVPLEKSPRNPYDGFLFLGRASTCDVIIRDASISKTHAVIEPSDGGWHLRDNRSRNGTWRNMDRLKDGERVALVSGDLIVLGSYPLYFLFSEDLMKLLVRSSARPSRV